MTRSRVFTAAFLLLLVTAETGCRTGDHQPTALYNPEKLAENFGLIQAARPALQNGDLIFRNGNDEVSQAARSMNRRDTSYSHCGLLFIENDSPFVYHAIGGIYNPSQRLRRDPLDSFCNPRENQAFAIYRYRLSPEEKTSLTGIVREHHRAGLKFDLYFNYQSDEVMYCSEFVFKSLNRARGYRMSSYVRMDTLPFGVTLDDVFLHPDCQPVKKTSFRQ